jgi:hypothetical protein
MVKYLKTKKGYFYKLKKNGEKKRISREEFNKTRKNKKMIGGGKRSERSVEPSSRSRSRSGSSPNSPIRSPQKRIRDEEQPPDHMTPIQPINDEDIMYQDDLVCILNPHVKKGIIVWTHFTQPAGMDSLCNLGLKTGKQLQREGIDFGRSKIHPYIFFRAPYYSRDIDYTTVEREIHSSYGEGQIGTEPRVFIRVDPDRTFVFSSEIRANIPTVYFHISDGHLITKKELSSTHSKFFMPSTDERYRKLYNEYYNHEINKSKKTLSEYLVIIKENELRPGPRTYDLHSSRKVRKVLIDSSEYPYNQYPIERMSEILVSKPHLTPDYFVLCTE